MHVFAQDLRGPYEGHLARAVVDVHGNVVLVERDVPADASLAARVTPDSSRSSGSEHARDRGHARVDDANRR